MEKMKNTQFEFNEIKRFIIEQAEKNGVSASRLNEEWSLDYSVDFNGKFEREIFFLSECMKLIELAKAKNDLLATKAAILIAGVRVGMLASFFESMDSDLSRVLREFEWPEFPENYRIPDFYNYRGSK